MGLQANNMAIDAASTQLVDQFAQQLATPGSDLRTLVDRNITDKLIFSKVINPGALPSSHQVTSPNETNSPVRALFKALSSSFLVIYIFSKRFSI